MKTYKIGTRGSLLAVTQCTLIKNQLEELTGDKFELVKIVTQGDQQTDKALWQMDGKDFFTKELDAALLSEQVDMVVHSYKDLGSERPDGIKLAAITKRALPNDILLIRNETIPNISKMDEFVVGTSSPRRIVNIESSLSGFLPMFSGRVTTKLLRGNVNTRIEKLINGDYDAIVLASAGLERLCHLPESRETLTGLLKELNFMLLPQNIFPTAASQGALAIEIFNARSDNGELELKLKKVEDAITVEEMKRERKAFQSYGGGCHLAVGINVQEYRGHYLHIHKGAVDHKLVEKSHWEGSSIEINAAELFIGLPMKDRNDSINYDRLIRKTEIAGVKSQGDHIFVTSQYCINALEKSKSVWASGTNTWKRLADKGHWVNGCADFRGHHFLESLKDYTLFQIFFGEKFIDKKQWEVLSHDKTTSKIGEVKACYTHELNDLTDNQVSELISRSSFYWPSFTSYKIYTDKYPELINKKHLCGFGKTYDQFLENNIEITAVPSWKMLNK